MKFSFLCLSGRRSTGRAAKRALANSKNKNNNSFIINPDIVTKTMYGLLIKQKKYNMENNILSAMLKEKKHIKFVNVEMKKIKKHIINKDKI